MGQMALSPSAFYSITLEEFNDAVIGYNRAQEMKERGEWERTRWLGTLVLQPHLRKGRKLQPKDLAEFPWEKPLKTNDKRRLTAQELLDEIQMRDGWQN